MSRILVVEDERGLARFLIKGLHSNGFSATTVEDGRSALDKTRAEAFDLVLLDLGLPDMDGLEVLSELRARDERVPVLILSARDELADKVGGLERGADDYVTKPFKFEELLARIRVRLREPGANVDRLEGACLVLDLRTRKAQVDGAWIDLSAREFTMLETLLRHRGQVLSREQLLAHVWGHDQDPDTKLVEVYVGYLRRKLGDEAIETRRGIGYVVR